MKRLFVIWDYSHDDKGLNLRLLVDCLFQLIEGYSEFIWCELNYEAT